MKAGRNKQVVERLFDALMDRDSERVQSFFTANSVLEPSGEHRVTGQTAILNALSPTNWQLQAIDEHGAEVVLERVRRRRVAGRWRTESVTSHLEVRGSKIQRWWDETDTSTTH